MNEGLCKYDYEGKNIALKQELDHTHKRLSECEQLLKEARKEVETLKVAYSEIEDELLRYEGKISAFEFVIKNGR